MNPKVVKLREEREKNAAKITSLQERNKCYRKQKGLFLRDK